MTMAGIRTRHYILTLQLGSDPSKCSTTSGELGSDLDEQDAFHKIWAGVCDNLCAKSGLDWNPDNTLVLFYRLAELRPEGDE